MVAYTKVLLATVAVVTGVRVDDVEDGENLALFSAGDMRSGKDWLESIEKQIVASTSTPISNSKFKTEVQAMLGPMMKATKSSNAEAQKNIDTSFTAFAACVKDYGVKMTQKKSEVQSFIKKKELHSACRLLEHEKWIDQNIDGIRKLKLKKEHEECTAYLAKHTTSRPSTCKSVDTKTENEAEEAWLRRMKSDFTAQLADYMAKKSSCEQKGREYDAAVVAWQIKTDAHSEKSRACNVVGVNMDVQACQASSTSSIACSEQSTCYASAVASYDAVKALVLKQESDHKAEYRVWKRVECMLGALGDGSAGTANQAKLEQCISAKHSTADLQITYPVDAVAPLCQANPMAPCTANYIADTWRLPEHASGQCTPCQ